MRSIVALLACVAVAAALTVGCGGKKTYTTPGGEVTVEEKGGEATATVTTEEGTATLETGAKAGEKGLGIPLYPGAESEQTVSWTGSGAEEGKVSQVALATSDSFDRVKAFYTGKFPKAKAAMEMSTAELQMVQLLVEDGKVKKSIMISRDKGEDKTKIVLQRMEQE